MEIHLYIEMINAIISILIFLMLANILWLMTKKHDLFKSILFLNGDKLKKPTIIILFGIGLFSIREVYKAIEFLGVNTSEFIVESLELGNVFLLFIGILIVFRLFHSRRAQ